jgi:hypothetical protein
MSWFNIFFQDRDALLSQMTEFDRKYRFGLIEKLKKEKVTVDFLSTITEIHFGLFFDQFCDNLKYNYPVFTGTSLTPDWTVEINGQEVIAEVLRMNATFKDQGILDVDTSLMDALEEITQPYLVSLEYTYEQIDLTGWSMSDFKQHVEDWLSITRTVNDRTTFQNQITVKIIQGNTGVEHVCVMGGFRKIDHKPERIMGANGRFLEKVNKYGPRVEQEGLPLIICIYVHFESWLQPRDIYKGLYGCSGEYIGNFDFKEYTPGAKFHDIGGGLCYSNEKVRKNVSGVLLRYQDKYTFFPNHSNVNRLNKANLTVLSQFAFEENVL